MQRPNVRNISHTPKKTHRAKNFFLRKKFLGNSQINQIVKELSQVLASPVWGASQATPLTVAAEHPLYPTR
jgi:hypothetical protein